MKLGQPRFALTRALAVKEIGFCFETAAGCTAAMLAGAAALRWLRPFWLNFIQPKRGYKSKKRKSRETGAFDWMFYSQSEKEKKNLL
ncbi:hypothetical protein [Paenibacillus sp. YIM B09110]|uniref:hypothetical protein n=1 Tax=Paenibacillus sp. YIM B09110 TaxID=3126102 RepID=UPI00301D0985